VIIGGFLAAIVGGLLALPVMRLAGLYLALATLAFAAMFEFVIAPQDWAGGERPPPSIPRPIIGPFDFSSTRSYFFLCLLILGIVAVGVLLVKRGTVGRYLDALRGSELAAASIGIDSRRARITAFALSAGIGGLGGGLLAVLDERAAPTDYTFILGLFWVVLVVTLGAPSIQAAITAGIMFRLFPELLSRIDIAALPEFLNPADNPQALAFTLFGLGALTYAKHPEGIHHRVPDHQVAGVREPPPPPAGRGGRARAGGGGRMTAVLEAERITKRFEGIVALSEVSLGVGARSWA
jgi:ABC-type branched-subunit amino acid transport system permease subunit